SSWLIEFVDINISERPDSCTVAPKPKANVRRTRSSSDTSITHPTAAVGPILTTTQKGKQTAKASKAKSLSTLSEVAMTEAQQLKLMTKKILQQTHISQASSSGADEGTGSILGVPDVPTDESEEELSWNSTNDEEVEDTYVTPTLVNPDGQQESSSVSSQFMTSLLNLTLDVGMESIFETTSRMDTNQFASAVSAIPEIVQQYMDQRMNEAVKVAVQIQSDRLRDEAQRENDEFLRTVDENIMKIIKEQVKEQVKILIEKIEGNKSIQRSDEQRNLYKALFDAYESDKIILDTYGETITLKRRRDDDEDKDEETSAGPDRGSKRRREGKEPESAITPSETATRSAGRSTKGSRSRQASTSESALAEEPVQTTSQMEEPSHPEFDTCA
nr:hypothetical protein [Tanacetum cinerariifolium]